MKISKLFAMGAALAAGTAAFAIDGKTVIQNALDVKEPAFSRAQVVMTNIEKNGERDMRQILEYGRSKNNLKSVVMDFVGPNTSKVKGTRFLQIENDGRDDDKFIYLPELRNTRRIAASEGTKSFMGTEATYDDMSSREIYQDTHELLKEESKSVGGASYSCYVVKSTPVDPKDSQYKHRIVWVDKNTWVPVYSEMYDKKGALLKVLTVEKLQNIQGYDIPMANKIVNVQTGRSTTLQIGKIELDVPFSEKVFTDSFLKTGKM